MAISPEQAAASNDQKHEAVLAHGEEELDKILRARYATGYAVSIRGEDFPIKDYYLSRVLVDRYRKTGWRVEHHDSQRDGVTWTFSKANKNVGGERGPEHT